MAPYRVAQFEIFRRLGYFKLLEGVFLLHFHRSEGANFQLVTKFLFEFLPNVLWGHLLICFDLINQIVFLNTKSILLRLQDKNEKNKPFCASRDTAGVRCY